MLNPAHTRRRCLPLTSALLRSGGCRSSVRPWDWSGCSASWSGRTRRLLHEALPQPNPPSTDLSGSTPPLACPAAGPSSGGNITGLMVLSGLVLVVLGCAVGGTGRETDRSVAPEAQAQPPPLPHPSPTQRCPPHLLRVLQVLQSRGRDGHVCPILAVPDRASEGDPVPSPLVQGDECGQQRLQVEDQQSRRRAH